MRSGEPFTDKDREFNNKALITTLKQIHDDLDHLTFQAYGWDDLIPQWQQIYCDPPQPPLQKGGAEKVSLDKGDLGGSNLKEQLEQSILQRLVDLNAERAQEERNGLIRWLRPEYQAPDQIATQKIIEGIDIAEETPETIAPPEQQKFPTKLKDQLATIRDLLRSQGGEWTVPQISAQFKGNSNKQQTAIQNCLDSLEELGVILSHTEAQTKRYFITD
jgi:predicted transcriptional regulator